MKTTEEKILQLLNDIREINTDELDDSEVDLDSISKLIDELSEKVKKKNCSDSKKTSKKS